LLGVIESTVYARSSGYVVRWTKDIGAPVKKGELLAQITGPEIDQQLNQAVAAARADRCQRSAGKEHRDALAKFAREGRGHAARTWTSG